MWVIPFVGFLRKQITHCISRPFVQFSYINPDTHSGGSVSQNVVAVAAFVRPSSRRNCVLISLSFLSSRKVELENNVSFIHRYLHLTVCQASPRRVEGRKPGRIVAV